MTPFDDADVSRPGATWTGALRDRLLRVSLFWKLLGAAVAVSGGTVLFVVWIAAREGFTATPATVIGLLAGIVLGTALVQATVLRVALVPLAGLEDAARRVRDGELGARAPASAVEDARMRRLRISFNEMLDEVEALRNRAGRAARATLDAEEEERDAVARELWAEPAQSLAGLLIRLRVLAKRNPEWTDATEELELSVREALEEVRRLARRLRPPELDELGVRAALAAHVRSLTVPSSLEPQLVGEIPEERLDAETSLALFRICQAAITHSVSRDPDGARPLQLTFRTGIGALDVDFHCPDGDRLEAEPTIEAWAERARLAGGALVARPAQRGGRRLRLSLPLRQEDAGRVRTAHDVPEHTIHSPQGASR
jgi:two-component system sensor histidine kinase UhpB